MEGLKAMDLEALRAVRNMYQQRVAALQVGAFVWRDFTPYSIAWRCSNPPEKTLLKRSKCSNFRTLAFFCCHVHLNVMLTIGSSFLFACEELHVFEAEEAEETPHLLFA